MFANMVYGVFILINVNDSCLLYSSGIFHVLSILWTSEVLSILSESEPVISIRDSEGGAGELLDGEGICKAGYAEG